MIYIYDGEHYTEHELIELAEEMAHYEAADYDNQESIRDIDDAILFLGEDEVDIVDVSKDGYMAKGGQHKVNKKYAYFAVNKKTNKIIDGWEIVDDVESLKYYAKMDLEDNDLNPKDYNLLSAKTLKARGIDPYSWDSWAKTGEYADGGITFEDKVESISESLYERKKVSPSVQKDYGKTYSKSEAIDSAKRIAGAMRKKEMAKKKS